MTNASQNFRLSIFSNQRNHINKRFILEYKYVDREMQQTSTLSRKGLYYTRHHRKSLLCPDLATKPYWSDVVQCHKDEGIRLFQLTGTLQTCASCLQDPNI